MAHLALHLLGPFQVTLDGEPVTGFESARVRALLAYLAVEADRPHRRESLAGLLWPNRPDRAAHGNLRRALYNLRTAVRDREAVPPFLLVARDSLQFNRASDHWLDVTALLAPADADQEDRATCRQLEEAVALYRGSFLEGFSLRESAAFEEWSLLVRDRFQRQASTALFRLVKTFEALGDYDRACRYARRQVELEPWQEEAHRRLMRLLVLSGRRSAALVQYETCRRALRDELDVEPGEETIRLYERIRSGELAPPAAPSPASPPSTAEPLPRGEVRAASHAAEPNDLAQRRERRTVTALIAAIAVSTAGGGPIDVEVRAEVMDRVSRIIGSEIDRYGGEIDRYRDDGLVALFGATAAHEDDPERAVLAALAIQDAAKRTATELAEREGIALSLLVGVNTGQVIAVTTGDRRYYWEVSALDRARALAAHTEAAQPVTVLVTGDTRRLIAPLFEWERVSPTADLESGRIVYRPLARRRLPDKGRGVEGLESPLVGRAAELRALQEAIARLGSGIGGIVTVVGEAGIGKSRLVAEVRSAADLRSAGLRWAEGRCLSYATGVAYHLWLDMLRELLGATPDASAAAVRDALWGWVQALCPDRADEVYPYLGRVMALPLGDEIDARLRGLDAESLQFVTFRAVETLLERATAEYRLVIVCEDLHWGDSTSLALLDHLLPLIDRVPLLIICVFRPEMERGCWQVRETAARRYRHCHTDLWLQPLTSAEGAALVGNLLHIEDLPPGLRERILEHAEGNPFYVEEILRSLIDGGVVVHDGASGRWEASGDVSDVAIPKTLQGLIAARIDHLPQGARRVLQLASVIGRIFTAPFLATIAEHPLGVKDLDAHLLALQRAQLIRERSRLPVREYAFKHVLTQEAAYGSLVRRERCAIHRRAARALEQLYPERIEEQLGLLAHHWEQAGQTDRACDTLRRAGEQAAAQYANDEAISYLSRALDLAPEGDLSGRYALLVDREGVCDMQGAREAQRQDLVALEKLAEALGDYGRQAEVACRKARYAYMLSDHQGAIAAAREAIRLARAAGDVACEADGHLRWGRTLRRMADAKAALPLLGRALALARRASLREMEAFSLRELGFACGYQGELAKARAYLEQSLDICRQIANPKTTGLVLRTLGLVLIHQGDYGLARSHSERALSTFREIGYRWGQGEALWTLALLFRRQGDYGRARMLFEQVLETTHETRSAERESRVLADLGLVSHCLGDDEMAREYGQQGLDVAERCGSLWYQAWACVVLGHALAGLAQFVGAIEAYRRAAALYREMHLSHWAANPLAGLARIALERGDRAEALTHAQEIMGLLQAHPRVASAEEPLRIYLTCHNVLRAVDDPRAEEVLEAGYLLIQERADTIEDEALRRSHLENVPYHRQIVAAWEEKHQTSAG